MNSILPNLSQYKIVLGSNSPRRRELLAGLDIDFEVQTIPDIDESFPKTLRSDEVPVYIARKKAEAYISSMSADELLITADTIVWTFSEILGKPKDREDAIAMLRKLSGHVPVFVLRQKKKRFLFPLHRPSALPGWMMTRSSTMSINIVRLIKPVAMAYRNGSGTWQSKPSMAVFLT